MNVLHNYVLKVRTDMRLEFRPLPTVPLFRVGPWAGADFKDASKNSLEDIYNRSIVEGTGADGGPVKVNRYASEQADVNLEVISSPAFANPSFDTNTTGWSASTGTLSRTTTAGEFDSSPAGLKWTVGASDQLVGTLTGLFNPGVTYIAEFAWRRSSGGTGIGVYIDVLLGGPLDFRRTRLLLNPTFNVVRLAWTPKTAHNGATLRIPLSVAFAVFLDSFVLYHARPTLPDRREFVRTHVHSMSQVVTPEVGQQIADTFLATHKRTPLKGDITVKGRGGVRRWLGDATVPPSELLIHTNELIHLSDQTDPDTGALGRDAPIDTVTWVEDEDTATISLDASRDNLAALLARYDAVVGGGR